MTGLVIGVAGQVPGGPFPGVGDALGASALDMVTRWIGDAAEPVTGQVVSFLSNSTGVDLAGAFGGEARTAVVFHRVLGLSGVLMVGFVFVGVIGGLAKGDPGSIARVALVRVPTSIAGTVALVVVTDLLLKVTDGASAFVISGAPGDLAAFTATISDALTHSGSGAAGGLLGLVYLLGALMCLLTLVVRSALIYLLVALAPVLLAARVWPAASGAFRKLCEVAAALIASKFAIALALGIGAGLLADGSSFGANSSVGLDSAGQSVGKLAAGAAVMGVAAFCPFLLLKLLPVIEAAVVAQGIGSAPVRGATQVTSMAFYGSSIRDRLTRSSAPGGASQPGPGDAGSGSGPGAGARLAPTKGPGTSTASTGGAGAASVAAGPAVVAVAGAQAAAGAARTVQQTVAGASDATATMTSPGTPRPDRPGDSTKAPGEPARPAPRPGRATAPDPNRGDD